MNFTPSETYEGLLIQAKAFHFLVENLTKTQTRQRELIVGLREQLNLLGTAELSSQKEMNEKLTNELDKANKRIEELERICMLDPDEHFDED